MRFRSLFRFTKKRAEPAPKPVGIVRPKKTASLVFVDMSNFYNRRFGPRRRIRWHEFRLKIAKLVEGTELRYSGAYYETSAQKLDQLDQVVDGFKKSGYEFLKYHKSADILIGSDMWREIVKTVATTKYDTVRIVLASGDDDFAKPLADIMELFKYELKFELHVVSWSESLGYTLSNLPVARLERVDEIRNIEKGKTKHMAASS